MFCQLILHLKKLRFFFYFTEQLKGKLGDRAKQEAQKLKK